MRTKKESVAMLLAGGQGSRLGVLTKTVAKPAIPFGGKYRIIDFTLSNCINSGIDTVGVLTQYMPLDLNAYIGNGQPWDLDRNDGGVSVLPPYVRGKDGQWYKGTANAIYQNMHFIERYDPEYVVILSGDHIYKMDYSKMIDYHRKKEAACTIAVLNVTLEEASRFGIMNTDEDNRIYEFEEKPAEPKSTKASMGVYVFSWKKLKKYLEEDENTPGSSNDFGKNIIPNMLGAGEAMYAYEFSGYWKDVGTLDSLWEANMELLDPANPINLSDPTWKIYARNPNEPPHFTAAEAQIKNSMITEGTRVYGTVEHSVIFHGVSIGKGAIVRDSVILPNSKIEDGAVVEYAIVGQEAVIGKNARVGCSKEEAMKTVQPDPMAGYMAVLADEIQIGENKTVQAGEMLAQDRL
ncbi:MAG: glucose-1-phosphate adenylyltransferase [Lachnospiraceae bacterium]|jgi:glucose-1-phosphate adenylyltransferase|nr:glucose-1-phosphate adenylyltransferase [Lachnospiraceae bacterium]